MFCCLCSKEISRSEGPLSVKLSVNRLVQLLLARTRQYYAETRPLLANAAVPDRVTIHNVKENIMNQRYILFRRAGVFYYEDTTTGKQISLRTKDEAEAKTLLHAKNESVRQPVLNLQIARAYLAASDPEVANRTWQLPMDEMTRTKHGPTRIRHERAMKDRAFDTIRNLPIVETNATHFLKALHKGSVATNVFLRRIHNFALDMNWLPWPVLPKKQWPKVRFKEKRAVTALEHQAIVATEKNHERRGILTENCG